MAELLCNFALHKNYFPYNYPAVPRKLMFGDFSLYAGQFSQFHTQQFFQQNKLMYPAPIMVFYKLFNLGDQSIGSQWLTYRLLLTMLIASWSMVFLFAKALVCRGLNWKTTLLFLLPTYIMSFPFWFDFHQANMEFIVWIVLSLGIRAFWNDKFSAAAVLFGIAAAMKIFPIIFVGLLITKRKFRQIALALISYVIVTVASLWMVCPNLTYSFQQTNMAVNRFRYEIMIQARDIETGFDHSLFGALKYIFHNHLPDAEKMSHLIGVYLAVVGVGGLILYVLRIRHLPILNQLFCLSIAAVLLPPTSFEYTLLHLYAPFAVLVLMVVEHAGGKELRMDSKVLAAFFTLMAFLFCVQSEFIYHAWRIAGPIKALALLALFACALRFPLPSADERFKEDAAGAAA